MNRLIKNTIIISIDASTNDDNIGIFQLVFDENGKISDKSCKVEKSIETILCGLKSQHKFKKIIAIDVPFGWPYKFGGVICNHLAGLPLQVQPDFLFSRVVENYLRYFTSLPGKPKEVAADKLARTTLSILNRIEKSINKEDTELNYEFKTWDSEVSRKDKVYFIEVYPKTSERYLFNGDNDVIKEFLRNQYRKDEYNKHQKDAILGALSAVDFVLGNVLKPEALKIGCVI